jgi:hypothetical protein
MKSQLWSRVSSAARDENVFEHSSIACAKATGCLGCSRASDGKRTIVAPRTADEVSFAGIFSSVVPR